MDSSAVISVSTSSFALMMATESFSSVSQGTRTGTSDTVCIQRSVLMQTFLKNL